MSGVPASGDGTSFRVGIVRGRRPMSPCSSGCPSVVCLWLATMDGQISSRSIRSHGRLVSAPSWWTRHASPRSSRPSLTVLLAAPLTADRRAWWILTGGPEVSAWTSAKGLVRLGRGLSGGGLASWVLVSVAVAVGVDGCVA